VCQSRVTARTGHYADDEGCQYLVAPQNPPGVGTLDPAMDEFWPAFFAGLAVLAVTAVAAWVWKPTRVRLQTWWTRGQDEYDEAAERADDRQLAELREQVIARANKLGITIPVDRSGNRVTYSDGHTSAFIPDFQQYRRAMQSGRADIMRTFNKEPPTPLSWRSREWMEEWLVENLEP
jgi:hypothetical protein